MEKLNPLLTHECSKEEDEDDTLSLSDLPMYCDHNIEFWVEDSNMISNDQDFEFLSEMMITSSHQTSSKPIVFCGKIIHVSPQKIESKKQQIRCIGTNVGRKVKVSVLNPATKSRWFLFMIGSRFPVKKMHIGDLRKRRSSGRRRKSNNGYSSSDEGDNRRRRFRGFLRFFGCGGGGGRGGSDDDDVTPCKQH
ncbi:hypothetical protein L6452_05599 [Arctium lappa]|uniref:Uncharacterized protein n=1 Tax=Arctium lappa TaxID=4217 RepID=A0ACB9EHW9_ARCLA|nr:hypothetical protein L6452_05599 [Arctium lappa]